MIDREDSLDRLLRNDARVALADDGFSARVLAALPPAVPRASFKPLLMIASTALGSALASTIAPVGPMVVDGFAHLAKLDLVAPSAGAAIAMILVIAVSGAVLAAED